VANNKLLKIIVVATIVLTTAIIHNISHTYNSFQIIGTWQSDITAPLNKAFNKLRLSAVNAHSTTTFKGDGTYTSEDTATLIATSGPRKGKSGPYLGWSKGTYTFSGDHGTVTEVDGERTASGHHIDVQLSDRITLRRHDSSSLEVIEDYGSHGKMMYVLYRVR